MTEPLRTVAAGIIHIGPRVLVFAALTGTAIRRIGVVLASGGAFRAKEMNLRIFRERTARQRENRYRGDKKSLEHDPSWVPGGRFDVTPPASSRPQGVQSGNGRFLESPLTDRGEREKPLEERQQHADAPADVCYLAASGSTHRGPLDTRAERVWARNE